MIATLTGREPHPAIPLLTPEVEQRLKALGKAELAEIYYKTRAQALILSKHDPLRHGMELPIWKKADEQVEELKKLFPHGVTHLVNLGANRCLVKGSLIYDPVKMVERPIEELTDNHNVFSYSPSQLNSVVASAEPSFSRGVLPCVRITTEYGGNLTCSVTHRLLANGTQGPVWREAGKFSVGEYVYCVNKITSMESVQDYECFDFHVPDYENYMHAGVYHHNSAKTTRAARRVMKLAVTKAGARIWCLHSTEAASRADQQPLIFDCLPPEWRPDSGKMRPKGNRTTKIVYSDSGGFTNNHLILPNGSQIWFKFYGANVKTLEGAEIDMAWADELIEPDWIEALRFRLVNRNGHLLLTFTPVEGYSATVRMYLENAVTLEETDAELLPIFDESGNTVAHQKVPRVQQSGIPQARIVYFHTIDNPFGNYEGMKVEARGSNEERIKMRVYGVPTKSSSSQFNFNSAVHVITEAEFAEWIKKYPDGTRYHLVDPCSGRNWFMGWAFCPRPDTVIWYREWPSHGHPKAYIEGIGDPGPWATLVTTKARREGTKAPEDGEKGPAQEPFKFSLRRYRDEIIKAEHGEVIYERWMDARYGNSPKEEEEGVTTLIQQMDLLGMQFCAMTSEKQILNASDGSIDMINSALYYDKSKPIGAYSDEMARINEPNMFVVETCPNLQFSLEIFTGRDGQRGACKDGCDILRGFFLSQLGYISPQSMRPRGFSIGY